MEKIGYLYKLHNKQWKKRWFVLRHGILYKYYSHKDKHPFGQYVWKNATVQKLEVDTRPKDKEDKHCCFMVTQKRKQYIFAAATEEEMDEWIAAIVGDDNEELYSGIAADGPQESRILGVPLDAIEHTNNEGLPIFITCLMDYLEATAIGNDDLFTQAPDPVLITQIQEGILDFELIKNPHAVAGLIQVFLHEMPIPVTTFELRKCFLGVSDITSLEIKIHVLSALVDALPPLHYNLLRHLCLFLKKLVDNGDESFLDHICNTFSVLLIRAPKTDTGSSSNLDLQSTRSNTNHIMRQLILHVDEICPSPLVIEREIEEDDNEHVTMENESESNEEIVGEVKESKRKGRKRTKGKETSETIVGDEAKPKKKKKKVQVSSENMDLDSSVTSPTKSDSKQKKKKVQSKPEEASSETTDEINQTASPRKSESKTKRKKIGKTEEPSVVPEIDNTPKKKKKTSSKINNEEKEKPIEKQEDLGTSKKKRKRKPKDSDAISPRKSNIEEPSKENKISESPIEESVVATKIEIKEERRIVHQDVEVKAEKKKKRTLKKSEESANPVDTKPETESVEPVADVKDIPTEEVSKEDIDTKEIEKEEEDKEVEETKEDEITVPDKEELKEDEKLEKETEETKEDESTVADKEEDKEVILEEIKTEIVVEEIVIDRKPPAVPIEDSEDAPPIPVRDSNDKPEEVKEDTEEEDKEEEEEEEESEEEKVGEVEEEEEEEETLPPSHLARLPQLSSGRLDTYGRNRTIGPAGRKRPTRRFKSPIIIPEFTVPEEAVKPAPTPRAMSPEQQMILEMSRLFKRKA